MSAVFHIYRGQNVRFPLSLLVIVTTVLPLPRSLWCVLLNVQMFCARSTGGCREKWTQSKWLFRCINVTHWHSKNCSQSSLWQSVQSKPQRGCWTSSWNSLTLSTCVSSTSWNTSDNITSIRHWSKLDTKVSRCELRLSLNLLQFYKETR